MEKEINEGTVADLRKPRTLAKPKIESFGACVTRLTTELIDEGMNESTAKKFARERCKPLKDIGDVEEEQEIKKNDALGSEGPIESRQTSMMHALLRIRDSLGLWDQGVGSDGAHYIFQSDNVFKDMGLKCGNCIFYRDPASCDIVRGIIQHNGLCKLNIIPEGVIDPDPDTVDEVPRVSESPELVGDELTPEEENQIASVDPNSLAALLKESELVAAGIKREDNTGE